MYEIWSVGHKPFEGFANVKVLLILGICMHRKASRKNKYNKHMLAGKNQLQATTTTTTTTISIVTRSAIEIAARTSYVC